ncbi:MAG: transglutaminase-like cysteine peptidase [Pseudomonadota bacterium]
MNTFLRRNTRASKIPHRLKAFICQAVSALVAALTLLSGSIGTAGTPNQFLEPQKSITAPSGFIGLCNRYDWVCTQSDHAGLPAKATFKLAQKINLHVNRRVREVEDIRQYGREEHWTLPSLRGGDCEDFVLLKKKMLVERGVASDQLLIATVLDKRLTSHAVLVLRTAQGDYILDNQNNRILPWQDTGYTFLKLQDPGALSNWHAIMVGGVITDYPTASK